jgi:hypothetical protein
MFNAEVPVEGVQAVTASGEEEKSKGNYVAHEIMMLIK